MRDKKILTNADLLMVDFFCDFNFFEYLNESLCELKTNGKNSSPLMTS